MKIKFLRFIMMFCALCCFCLPLQAKVYWVGRNIDISPSENEEDNPNMLKIMGHSYLIILPDNPEKLKERFPDYTNLEKDWGCGHKGIVIGGYPMGGSDMIANLDGNLEALINASREVVPTNHYFCGTDGEKAQWNFVGEPVETNLSDEEFIINIVTRTRAYIYNTSISPLDYHAVRSGIDALGKLNDTAQNCNALAFSILSYAGATKVPDIGASRSMPGNRNLLPEYLFYFGPVMRDALEDSTPDVKKNDMEYEERVKYIKDIDAHRKKIWRSIHTIFLPNMDLPL